METGQAKGTKGFIQAGIVYEMSAVQFQAFIKELRDGNWMKGVPPELTIVDNTPGASSASIPKYLKKRVVSPSFRAPKVEFRDLNDMVSWFRQAIPPVVTTTGEGLYDATGRDATRSSLQPNVFQSGFFYRHPS